MNTSSPWAFADTKKANAIAATIWKYFILTPFTHLYPLSRTLNIYKNLHFGTKRHKNMPERGLSGIKKGVKGAPGP
jgi:hypothetical protein